MPVGGRINREQERVSAGPGHRAVERRLDRTDQLLELRAGPDMIGEGRDQRMLDRIAPLAETEAALDGRAAPVDLRTTTHMHARPDISFTQPYHSLATNRRGAPMKNMDN